ncbi:MAG: EAL domain-containing protein [Methylococcaceae bacterium]|nr:EAL domain-containing protein [Methylococcaceae bacterium]
MLLNILMTGIVALLYALLAWSAVVYAPVDFITIVWPASGFAVAALLIGGQRYALSIFFGSLLTYILLNKPLTAAAAMALGSTLEAMAVVCLINRQGKLPSHLTTLRSYLQFIVAAGVGSTIAAIIGVSSLLIYGFISEQSYLHSLAQWWMGDTLGIMLITPSLLIWRKFPDDWRGTKRILEIVATISLIALMGQVVFLGWLYEFVGLVAKGSLMFLFVTWVAVRLGIHGTLIVVMLVAVQALLGAIEGVGYFADDIKTTELTNYWLYIVSLSVAGMALATYFSEFKRGEVQLKLAAKVFEQSTEGFLITDAQSNVIRVNHAFTAITGYSEDEVLGQNPRFLSSGRQNQDFYRTMWQQINSIGYWQGEIWNRRKNGQEYPEFLSISAVHNQLGQVTEYVAVFSDITKQKASEDQLTFNAMHDPLTALPNRVLLFHSLEHAIEMAHREGKQLALLMLDLDGFKHVNDSFGHLLGDQLLQQVAERLASRLRGVDMVARLGGDEFTVLLEDLAHEDDAARVAEAIIEDLSEPWQLPGVGEVRIGVSIGISLYPQHGDNPEILLQQADTALYHSKAAGRNRFSYFSDELTVAARLRIDMEARLRRAILQNELRVYYQPQVDMNSGLIVGAEALVRWQDPIEGLIPPLRFIPLAEETGLIMAIGEWVLRETCRQGKAWMDAGLPKLSLAVNVSPQQIQRGNMSKLVETILTETGFPAKQLELELTETGLMNHQQHTVNLLKDLRAQGIRLAIDDFVTGYSSLAHLKHFPLDVLKIDKSFIDDIPHHQDDMEITATILAMGHILGFKVLAEGVETLEQFAFLQVQGCDLYQGYFKSRPLPADEFAELLRKDVRVKAAPKLAVSY